MVKVLVTNDDGYNAPGIEVLVKAMKAIGEVTVAAPARNQSASGHKKALFQDIPFERKELFGCPALIVDGSPADCIAVSALGLSDWPPDIVVSGINRGANMGQDVTYSGTVTAALEAAIHGAAAVAVSLTSRDGINVEDYEEAGRISQMVVRKVLEKGLPPLTILNLNLPWGKVKGIRYTRQGIRIYNDLLEVNETGGIAQIGGPPPSGMIDEEGTDLWAVHHGYASLTPIHLDLTAHHFMGNIVNWDIDVNGE
ncbi:5'/3'-nucleotidase SurE [Anaerolineales bacterium]